MNSSAICHHQVSWGEADSGLSKNVMFLRGQPMSDPTAPLAGLGLPAHCFQVDGFAKGPWRVLAAAQGKCQHHVAESVCWDQHTAGPH